jgi:hypothetical protein
MMVIRLTSSHFDLKIVQNTTMKALPRIIKGVNSELRIKMEGSSISPERKVSIPVINKNRLKKAASILKTLVMRSR